tara:strand:- start:2203 stop:2613 length:411 start_codon:yes stop_codon:yes gene_type:complete
MKATVKEVTVTSITVEYENGTHALIPIEKQQDKNAIKETVKIYNNTFEPFSKVADVPVSVGEEFDLDPTVEDADVDYRQARLAHYPRLQKQMDAAYWARQGDDTQQKAVDAEIDNVKTKIPKSWTGKQSEIQTLLD